MIERFLGDNGETVEEIADVLAKVRKAVEKGRNELKENEQGIQHGYALQERAREGIIQVMKSMERYPDHPVIKDAFMQMNTARDAMIGAQQEYVDKVKELEVTFDALVDELDTLETKYRGKLHS